MVDEALKRSAYLEGMRLKKGGADDELIYARLEKQGASEELIKEVIQNVNLQQKRDITEQQNPLYYSGLIKACLGFLLAIVTFLIYPDMIIIPVGFMVTGKILL